MKKVRRKRAPKDKVRKYKLRWKNKSKEWEEKEIVKIRREKSDEKI